MKRLPPRPDLGHLKKQAKTLLAEARAGDAAALARLQPLALPASADLRLHHAQWCLAREHGFASWPQFQAFVLARRALADDPQRSLATWLRWVYAGDIAGGADNARPEVAARLLDEGLVSLPADDPWIACAVGDIAVLQRASAQDVGWLHRAGGPLALPPLVAVAHSSLLRLPGWRERLHACARWLLDAGARADQATGSRWHPGSVAQPDMRHPLSSLYGAAGQNHDGLLTRWLLEAGADPNDGESLYHSLGGPLEITRMLLQAGARVTGSNALYRVLDLDDLLALQLLLAHGGDANEHGPGGHSDGDLDIGAAGAHASPWGAPLLWAIRRRRSLAHVQALLNAGGDPAVASPDGTTAHQWALRYGLPDVAAELATRLAQRQAPVAALTTADRFVAACARGDEADARQMLATQPDVLAALPPAQLSLLSELAAAGARDAVHTMVRLGWPIAVQGGDWDASALNQAVFRGDAALARFLLAHGAHWGERQGFGDNVCGTLSWASINTPEAGGDWAGCAQALLDHGLPPAAPDPNGSDAVLLDGRLMRFSDEVTDCLLAAGELPVQSAQ